MSDWQTVRYDPTYPEPLDPELLPLLDAMNAAGFVTIASCCGHGANWPYVFFAHSSDERIERLARFVKSSEIGDFRPFFSRWQKETLLEPNGLSHGQAYEWCVTLHLNNCYGDTPTAEALAAAVKAIESTAARVAEFAACETHGPT
jgi:hypothetical protein